MANSTFAQTSQYASGWSGSPPGGVTPGVDWFPLPPDPNPTGPPDANCVGTSNEGAVWAQFTFPSFGLPGGSTVVGIEVNVNYGSVVAPDMQLYLSGSPVGSTRVLPATPATPNCNASVIRTAGGPMDDWGAGLTVADFNTAGDVAVRLTRTTDPDMPISIDIESVQLVVYLDSDNSDPDCSGAAIADQIADASCQATISGSDVTGVTDPDGDMLTISVNPTTLSLGANSVTVMADDGNGGTCSEDITVTVVDVTNPVITCPMDATVDADAVCEASYASPPATATDNCPGVGVSSVPPLPALFSGLGANVIAYTATDGSGNTAMCDQTVTVQDVTPPVITLTPPDPVTLECAIDGYVEPGASAVDNCDPSPTLTDDADTAVDEGTPGSYTVTYTAEDASGNSDTDTRGVNVIDTTPPEITLAAGPIELWPPNHKYHTIGLDDLVTSASDLCDETVSAADVVTASTSSDEVENGQGDGNTTDDIVIAGDCRSVDLRAERQGGSNGRVYTLNLEVADADNNVGMGAFEVHVPHSKKSGAVDDGPAYSVAGCAPTRVATLDEVEATAQAESLEEAAAATPVARHAPGEDEGLDVAAEELPEAFMLHGNRPNPFNPQTTIRFDMPEAAYVTLAVYDMLGRQVRVLVEGTREAGTHEVTFEAHTLPSGMYLYRLNTPAGSFTGSMLLLK